MTFMVGGRDPGASSDPEPSGGARAIGRPRDRDVDKKLIDTAIDLYVEKGWGSFNFDMIAKRASVGKAAVYRRYRSREELLVDAIANTLTSYAEIDTGDLRSDLRSFIVATFELRMDRSGTAVLRILADQLYNNTLAELYRKRVVMPRVRVARKIIERAKMRGQISQDVDANLLLELIAGAVSMRVWDTRLESRDKLRSLLDRYCDDILKVIFESPGV